MVQDRAFEQSATRKLVAIATATTAAASAAISAATATALDLGTRFVHVQGASANLSAVQRGDGLVAFFGVAHFNKAKTAGAASVPVGHNADSIYLSMCFEKLAQLVFGGVEVEIPNENVLQATCLGVSYLNVGDFGATGRLVGQAECQS